MNKAIIVVDVENDFINGSLPVPNGEEVVPEINALIDRERPKMVIYTKDWHPADHSSFQTWPSHCVKYTYGSNLHKDLRVVSDYIILK